MTDPSIAPNDEIPTPSRTGVSSRIVGALIIVVCCLASAGHVLAAQGDVLGALQGAFLDGKQVGSGTLIVGLGVSGSVMAGLACWLLLRRSALQGLFGALLFLYSSGLAWVAEEPSFDFMYFGLSAGYHYRTGSPLIGYQWALTGLYEYGTFSQSPHMDVGAFTVTASDADGPIFTLICAPTGPGVSCHDLAWLSLRYASKHN